MSRQESLLISAVIKAGTLKHATREGVLPEHFTTYREEWEWLIRQPSVPSRAVFADQFRDFRWRKVRTEDLPTIIASLKEQYIKQQAARVIEQAAKNLKKLKGDEIAHYLRNEANSILTRTAAGGVVDVFGEGKTFYKQYQEKRAALDRGEMVGIPTGIPTIDRQIGGLLPERLYLVIARQGQAKTYMMLYFAAKAILSGHRVLWVSREMPEDMVAYRLHSIMSTILRGPDKAFSNLSLILGRQDVDADDYWKFLRYLRKNMKDRLIVPRSRTVNIYQMEQYIEQHAPDVAFYDYFGMIGRGDSNRSWSELGEQINVAKEYALKYRMPIVTASQVNRQGASKEGGSEAPMVEHIAFSDSIGYTGDHVIATRLSPADPNDLSGNRLLEIWVRKARYGVDEYNIVCEFNGDKGYLKEIGEDVLRSRDEGQTKKKRKKNSKKTRSHRNGSKPED